MNNFETPLLSDFERVANAHLTFSLATYKDATALSCLLKLGEEMKEVANAIFTGEEKLIEEYADCFLCLIDSAARSNIFMAQVIEAMGNKVIKNRNRTWIKNEDNTYSHVKKEQ